MSLASSQLDPILDEKISYLRELEGIDTQIMTQMGLSKRGIDTWLSSTREKHPDIPIKIGVAIPPDGNFIQRIQKQWGYIQKCELEKQSMYVLLKQIITGRFF